MAMVIMSRSLSGRQLQHLSSLFFFFFQLWPRPAGTGLLVVIIAQWTKQARSTVRVQRGHNHSRSRRCSAVVVGRCCGDRLLWLKWRATYTSAIPNDMHVKLAESSTNDAPCVDQNDPDARIIMFRPFYFSLGFTFPLSKFFRKVFCIVECAPIKSRAYEKYAEVRVCKAKLFHSFSQNDHVWHVNVLEVSGWWEENDICKRLDLGLDMVKVHRALNIPVRFRE
ncbi:unnamed protein product [Prunus armeniaca]